MPAPDRGPTVYLSATDCIRDRMFGERLQLRMKSAKVPVRFIAPARASPVWSERREEIERGLIGAVGVLGLYSRESADDPGCRYEFSRFSAMGRPGLLCVFREADPPKWLDAPEHLYDLEGVSDNGPALPPGTDEGRFFQTSHFVEGTLVRVEEFVRSVLDGTAEPLPPITPPRQATP